MRFISSYAPNQWRLSTSAQICLWQGHSTGVQKTEQEVPPWQEQGSRCRGEIRRDCPCVWSTIWCYSTEPFIIPRVRSSYLIRNAKSMTDMEKRDWRPTRVDRPSKIPLISSPISSAGAVGFLRLHPECSALMISSPSRANSQGAFVRYRIWAAFGRYVCISPANCLSTWLYEYTRYGGASIDVSLHVLGPSILLNVFTVCITKTCALRPLQRNGSCIWQRYPHLWWMQWRWRQDCQATDFPRNVCSKPSHM